MEKKQQKIIILVITIFVVLPLLAFAVYKLTTHNASNGQNNKLPPVSNDGTSQPLPNRSNKDLIDAAAKDTNLNDGNGNPIFTIDRTIHPQAGWYIATIYLSYDTHKTNPAKIILRDYPGYGLRLVLGPGSAFSATEIKQAGIPDQVAKDI
jgi:hypothetical protein